MVSMMLDIKQIFIRNPVLDVLNTQYTYYVYKVKYIKRNILFYIIIFLHIYP